LVLTGHMRTWELAKGTLIRNFIEKYDAEVFISTWRNKGYWVSPDQDPNNKGINSNSPNLHLEDEKKIFTELGPLVMNIDEYEKWGFEKDFTKRAAKYLPFCQEIRPVNIISQFYKMYDGLTLLENHVARTGTQYDLVIRTRPDVIWNDISLDFEPEKFYTNFHRNHTGQGTGDLLQVSGYKQMMIFKKLIFNLDELTAYNNRFCPHIFVDTYLKHFIGIDYVELNIPKVIMHTPQGQYQNFTSNI